jgi:hypothetical protein
MEPEAGDPLATLRPLLNEIMTEDVLRQCVTQVAPMFWSHFSNGMSAVDALEALLVAVRQLQQFLFTSSGATQLSEYSLGQNLDSPGSCSLSALLNSSLCLQIPQYFSGLLENVCVKAFQCWGTASEDKDKSPRQESMFWEHFKEVMAILRSLNLFHTFMAFPLSNVVQGQIEKQLSDDCSGNFDESMLEDATESLCDLLLSWLRHIVDNSVHVLRQWKSQVMYTSYRHFAMLRISELFEIIVDYPDSEPALRDLAKCLKSVALKQALISSLDKSFRKRLLHPGVNTADIITQYVSAVKALRLLDPSGVVLEKVCSPVREYLYNRDDTVRSIVASLTNDSDSELAEELIKGESNAVSENDDQDFDSWEPDPADANPDITSVTRKSSDIIRYG